MKLLVIVGATALCFALAWWIFINPITPTLVFEAARDVKPEVVITPNPESIFFVGDIMLARDVEYKLSKQTPAYAFEALPLLHTAKWVVGNFEASIPEVHMPTASMVMRFSVSPALLTVLEAGRVTHLSLANNHALDYFEAGYMNSVTELEARDFNVFGHPVRIDESSVSYMEAGGRTVALVGINATYGDIPSTWRDTLAAASLQSDIQIAYIHWGNEYELIHSAPQAELGHLLIDTGFEMVIGHHPHVVQDIELYGEGIIFYSLGNFIFDQYWNDDVSEGLMLELVVEPKELAVVLHPVETRTTRVKPRLMSELETATFLEKLARRSSLSLGESIKAGTIPLQF